MAFYSIIVKNGLVFDGSGEPGRRADVGIDADRISAVGDLSGSEAETEIDASGLYVTPGFIDLTNHSDTHWTIFDRPEQDSLLKQGVTTVLGGNCGSSLAPLVRASDIGSIQKWVDVSKININWQTMAEFFNELERHNIALNFATLVGHGTLRRASGMDVGRAASPEEIKKMSYLLYQALGDGAFGVSTSLGRSDELSADNEEINQLLIQAKKFGGLVSHHLENEGYEVVSATSRLINFSRRSGAKGHVSHFKVLGRKSWPKQNTAFEIIERAREEGVEFTIDVFPYTATGSNLYMLLPEWVLEGGKELMLKKLKDKNQKNLIMNELQNLTLHYEKITVASTLHDMASVGKTIKNLADSSGFSPERIIVDLLLNNELAVSIFNENISDENLISALKKDYAAIASDGVGLGIKSVPNDLPHPRSFGTFARIFSRFVRQEGIIPWEKAIYKMTALPAKILGLENRGTIEKGAFGDIAVFDPQAVGDAADYKTPRQFSKGFHFVFVNGAVSVAEGNLTGRFAGRILKRPNA